MQVTKGVLISVWKYTRVGTRDREKQEGWQGRDGAGEGGRGWRDGNKGTEWDRDGGLSPPGSFLVGAYAVCSHLQCELLLHTSISGYFSTNSDKKRSVIRKMSRIWIRLIRMKFKHQYYYTCNVYWEYALEGIMTNISELVETAGAETLWRNIINMLHWK